MTFETIHKLQFSDLKPGSLEQVCEKNRIILSDPKEIVDLLKMAKISKVSFTIQTQNQKIQQPIVELNKDGNQI